MTNMPPRRKCSREGCDETFVCRAFSGRRAPRLYCRDKCAKLAAAAKRRAKL
jgi:hypothetical protein